MVPARNTSWPLAVRAVRQQVNDVRMPMSCGNRSTRHEVESAMMIPRHNDEVLGVVGLLVLHEMRHNDEVLGVVGLPIIGSHDDEVLGVGGLPLVGNHSTKSKLGCRGRGREDDPEADAGDAIIVGLPLAGRHNTNNTAWTENYGGTTVRRQL